MDPNSGLDDVPCCMEGDVSLNDVTPTGSSGAFRALDTGLTVSAFVYISYGVEDCAALDKYLTTVCEKRNSHIVFHTIHRDPLPLRDSPYPRFVVEFDNAVQSAIMSKLLAESPSDHQLWFYISEDRAAHIALVATDRWVAPYFPAPPSYLQLTSGQLHDRPPSQIRSSPSTMTVQSQYSSMPPTGASISINPSPDAGGQSPRRPRVHKRGANRTRSGCREALTHMFEKPFWDVVDTITNEELATCSVAQQEFIARKKAEREEKRERERNAGRESCSVDREDMVTSD